MTSTAKRLATLCYFASLGVIGLVSAAIAPTLQGLADQAMVPLATVGFVITSRSLGYLIGAIWGGRWSDGTNAHRMIGTTLSITTVSLLMLPITSSFWVLQAIMLLVGICLGALDVAGNALVLRIHSERAAPYMNALHFFFGLGGFIAPFLVAGIAAILPGVRWAYWALAIVPIPFAAIILSIDTPGLALGIYVLQKSRKAVGLSWGFVLSASTYIFYVGGQISFVSWFYVYAEHHTSSEMATWVLGAFWGAFSLFRLLGVIFAKKWSAERILLIDYSVLLTAALPLLLWPGSTTGLWIAGIAMGAAHASIYATTVLFLRRRYPVAGIQMGAITFLACLGMMLFPWLTGRLLPMLGSWIVPGLSTLLSGIAFSIILVTARRRPVLLTEDIWHT